MHGEVGEAPAAGGAVRAPAAKRGAPRPAHSQPTAAQRSRRAPGWHQAATVAGWPGCRSNVARLTVKGRPPVGQRRPAGGPSCPPQRCAPRPAGSRGRGAQRGGEGFTMWSGQNQGRRPCCRPGGGARASNPRCIPLSRALAQRGGERQRQGERQGRAGQVGVVMVVGSACLEVRQQAGHVLLHKIMQLGRLRSNSEVEVWGLGGGGEHS